MSKLHTAIKLTKDPNALIRVLGEKWRNKVCFPVKEYFVKKGYVPTQPEYQVDNYCKPGISKKVFRKEYKRLFFWHRKSMIFAPYIGIEGTLATTNYYTNWLRGFRDNSIDCFWYAREMYQKPEFDLGVMSGPLLVAPYKDSPSKIHRMLRFQKCEFMLFHNTYMSLDYIESNNLSNTKKIFFIGDSMIPRIKDEEQRNAHISRIISNVDGLIVVSSHLKNQWSEYGFDPNKIFLTRTPVDAITWPKHKGSGSGSMMAAYFGNIYHKEIENILEISEVVSQKLDNFSVEIYGDGLPSDFDKLEEKINKRGLKEIIKLMPSVSFSEMQKIQSERDLLILPREKAEFSDAGFPNKIGEYLASGCPTVCTAVGEIENVLSNMENIILVQPNDNELFAQVVINTFANYERAKEIAENGRNFIQSFASPRLVCAQFLEWMQCTYE